MTESLPPLVLQFLSWIAARPRTYADTMEAWQTSCPRASVWEDSLIGGLVRIEGNGKLRDATVVLTALGRTVAQPKLQPSS